MITNRNRGLLRTMVESGAMLVVVVSGNVMSVTDAVRDDNVLAGDVGGAVEGAVVVPSNGEMTPFGPGTIAVLL